MDSSLSIYSRSLYNVLSAIYFSIFLFFYFLAFIAPTSAINTQELFLFLVVTFYVGLLAEISHRRIDWCNLLFKNGLFRFFFFLVGAGEKRFPCMQSRFWMGLPKLEAPAITIVREKVFYSIIFWKYQSECSAYESIYS